MNELNQTTAAIIARLQSAKKTFEVVTLLADGTARHHMTVTREQAENYAVGERRKIGKQFIHRETGAIVEVTDVYVSAL